MFTDRLPLYKALEKEFNSKLLVYVTSDRQNMGAQIASDVIDYFIDHLDKIGACDKISLFLYTRGGDTSAARNIVNLLQIYCDKLQVIVPHKAHSAGTIIALGANEIVMSKQATLGPIDPSLESPLNPLLSDGTRFPVSVEAVKGYLQFAKDELGIQEQSALTSVFAKLTDYVHPLVLGEVYRSKDQIKMMAEQLITNQVTDQEKVNRIIDFLCSESGSHDYTINRREAKDNLGLNIIRPTQKQYEIIWSIYKDFCDELQLRTPFRIADVNGAYAIRRGILESVCGGADFFSTEGEVSHGQLPDGKEAIRNKITFEGWRHDSFANRKEEVTEIGEGEMYESGTEFQL